LSEQYFFEKFETKVKIISDGIKERSIQEELAEDIISIIHLFSEKLYGLRSAFILIMYSSSLPNRIFQLNIQINLKIIPSASRLL
jgi:hypothetical protein